MTLVLLDAGADLEDVCRLLSDTRFGLLCCLSRDREGVVFLFRVAVSPLSERSDKHFSDVLLH